MLESGKPVEVEIRKRINEPAEVFVNGGRVTVLRTRLYRDGGTRVFYCEEGTLTLPRRIGDPDRTPRWRPKADDD